MDTESNQSNEDRYQDVSQEDERQRTGLFRWEEPHNLMPPWSVPPGLLVPRPHQPDADATPSRSAHASATPEPANPGSDPEPPAWPARQAAESAQPGASAQPAARPAQPAARPVQSAAEPAQLAGDPAGAPQPADPAASEPVGDDNSWPGVALPAGWFLRAQPPAPAARAESRAAAPGTADETKVGLDRITAGPHAPEPDEPSEGYSADLHPDQGLQPDAGLRTDGDAQVDAGAQRGAGPERSEDGSLTLDDGPLDDGPLDDVTSRPGLWPIASSWPNAGSGAVPSPRREPDGTWSSPLTPRPPGRSLSPTQARPGRPGGPGIQPGRSSEPGLSPWQRSHQLWTETGVQWEQDPAGQVRSLPAGNLPRRTPSSAARRPPAQARHQAQFTPAPAPAPALHQALPQAPPQVPAPRPAPAQSPRPAQVPRQTPAPSQPQHQPQRRPEHQPQSQPQGQSERQPQPQPQHPSAPPEQVPGRHTRSAPRGDEQPGPYAPDD